MNTFIQKVAYKSKTIVEFLFFALFLLGPVILTKYNYELFEFNKMLFVYGITVLVFFFFSLRIVVYKKIDVPRNPLSIPLLLFTVAVVISTMQSIDKHMSLWGYYGRFNGGLLSIVCYVFLYFAFVGGVRKEKIPFLLKTLIFSTVLVACYGILQHFGVDDQLWVQDVRNRVFSTLGQPNWLAALITAVFPLTLSFQLLIKNKNKAKRAYYYFYAILLLLVQSILYLTLLYTKSRSGFGAFWFSFWLFCLLLFILVVLNKKPVKPILTQFCITLVTLVTITFLSNWPIKTLPNPLSFSLPVLAQGVTQQEASPTALLITDSGDIRKIVWKGAVDSFLARPLFGWGPETFAWVYYSFRPLEHNMTSEWDFLYNKAHNEYLNIASTLGIAGILTYVYLLMSVGIFSIALLFLGKRGKTHKLQNNRVFTAFFPIKDLVPITFESKLLVLGVFSGWISILVTNFFGFSVVTTNTLLFLLPAFIVSLSEYSQSSVSLLKQKIESLIHIHVHNNNESKNLSFLQWIFLVVLAILSVILLYHIIVYWRADFFFAEGKNAYEKGQYESAVNQYKKALTLRPFELLFKSELSEAYVINALSNESLDQTTVSTDIDKALLLSQQVLEASPVSLSYWKTRVRLMFVLSQVNPDYLDEAIESIKVAQKLAPTDPKIVYNLAILYESDENIPEAEANYIKALDLKPNYKDAAFSLAELFEKENKKQDAKKWLNYILERIDPNDIEVQKKLSTLN
jgi:Flp pilus assembly protein TadD/O-antigen ligase